jgi:TetR/AcrR family transcriptional repressor of nem operon
LLVIYGSEDKILAFIPTGWYAIAMTETLPVAPAKTRLMAAALGLVRQRGYDSTSVDELCSQAGVTKGAFFHHFKTKEDLAVAATGFWTEVTNKVFEQADYHRFEDPLDQLVGYIDFRIQLLEGRSLPECTCFLGTMAQEKYDTSPAIRDACFVGIHTHAMDVGKIIKVAKDRHAPHASWSVESLALYTQAVIQGAFVLAKAKDDVALAADMIRHLRRYVELLFHHAREE